MIMTFFLVSNIYGELIVDKAIYQKIKVGFVNPLIFFLLFIYLF